VAGLILKPGAGTSTLAFKIFKQRLHISSKRAMFPIFHVFDISLATSTLTEPTSTFASKSVLVGSD
jgi:hypothetical protein